MKKLFIPYNLSLIAKEKGFDEPCLAIYNTAEYLLFNQIVKFENKRFPVLTEMNFDVDKEDVAAPLYQQIVDWFREKYNIIIQPTYVGSTKDFDKFIPDIYADNVYENSDETSYGYYGALNNAIEEAFELIS